jgi:chaperone modulatory protein CbpM
MMTIDGLIAEIGQVDRADLERWIGEGWVRPQGEPDAYRFVEIDVARVRLICTLRVDMEVNEAALPVVLSLLDQLYDTRRQMRELIERVRQVAPPDLHD